MQQKLLFINEKSITQRICYKIYTNILNATTITLYTVYLCCKRDFSFLCNYQ